MIIKPIRSEADYDAAMARLDQIWDPEPGTQEADEFEVLTLLVERYEDSRHPIDPPDPVAAILFRMDQQGLTRRDLEPFIGSRARVSEVLGGRRPLTLDMIRRLHAGLGIPLESLIGTSSERAGERWSGSVGAGGKVAKRVLRGAE
jgi:HTH-type transcriptional regulator/antitoxin HigA